MVLRDPHALGWYPSDARSCSGTIEAYLEAIDLPQLPDPLLGGLVPHAGWRFSGATAAVTFAALAHSSPRPDVVVVLGAVHSPGVSGPSLCSYEAWRTPVGDLSVDRKLRRALIGTGAVDVNDRAHAAEHSIEVQVPLLKYILPEAQFLPIAVPADATALSFGELLAKALEADGRRVAVLASSDLTHYGDAYGFAPGGGGEQGMEWARANDEALLRHVADLDAAGVLEHARRRHSACGSGALACAMMAVETLGARKGQILRRTSSYEEEPGHGPRMWVGYASAVFSP